MEIRSRDVAAISGQALAQGMATLEVRDEGPPPYQTRNDLLALPRPRPADSSFTRLPRLAGKAVQGFVAYGERQQAHYFLSDLGDPVLSSTPPPVVDLFGGRHVASPCSARR